MTDPLLSVEGLEVRYGVIRAVRDVSLEVWSGEVVALLGANGVGKTSTLGALMGLVPPAAGRVRFAGEDITGRGPEWVVGAGMTLTPEGRHVFATLSVAENLRLGGYRSRKSGNQAELEEDLLELFPILRRRYDQLAGTLSGGEQQQLAIARSLMSRPKLLLLDEPTLGIAPQIAEAMFDLIETLRERGLTILVVEQNVHHSLEIADRAYVLANGEVAIKGSATELSESGEIQRAYLGVTEPQS